jgi:SpoVK/Ycf46/Vps4 family AAA+-type ATPase
MRIGFDEKIIIFEDIDCMGDIVLNRASKKSKKTKREKNEGSVKKNRLCDAIEKLVENEIPSSPPIHDPITLDDLLNLWDGLRETPGRIMGISSNHYSELDPALVRPGRIDMTIHFENATRKIIGEMYSHYYGRKIDKSRLAKIRDRFYSPAEIINCYVLHKDSGGDFLDRLMENRKM